jgi:hypothetical protein
MNTELKKAIERIESIENQLLKLTFDVLRKQSNLPESMFFDNSEFIQIMNISKRTAQIWRDTGIIRYSQIGSKIYYKLTDINNLINENLIKNEKHNTI